jgi:hypothetical protein
VSEIDEASLRVFRRGWCLGSEEFSGKLLELIEGKLSDNHSRELRRETVENKAERIIAEELSRLNWAEPDLASRPRNDPCKLAIAASVRRETTLPIKWIAARLALGTAKSGNTLLHKWLQNHESQTTPQFRVQPMV